MAGFKVNFSDQEASSEARSFEPLPTGQYYCRVTDGELAECGPDSKNPGKPYYKLEFTVQDGPHEGRKLWTNAMLFEGALYTISQLIKATGIGSIEKGNIPDVEEYVSKEVVIVARKVRDTFAMERDGTDEVQWKTEVKGIKKYEGESPSAAGHKTTKAGAGSLLP